MGAAGPTIMGLSLFHVELAVENASDAAGVRRMGV